MNQYEIIEDTSGNWELHCFDELVDTFSDYDDVEDHLIPMIDPGDSIGVIQKNGVFELFTIEPNGLDWHRVN